MSRDIVYGVHPVHALLSQRPEQVVRVVVAKQRVDERANTIIQLADRCGVTCESLPKNTLDKLTDGAAHQGVMAEVRGMPAIDERQLLRVIDAATDPLLLVLDQIQDPHNLGACLRNAEAAGVTAVILTKQNTSPITPTVRKVASGAAELVSVVRVANLARSLDQLRDNGIWVVGTDQDAEESLHDVDLSGPIAWVVGTEGSGLRRLTRTKCDLVVCIPMQGVVSSLNVSVATGICLFETLRQRRSKVKL